MSDFNHREWFKKQYLEEDKSDNDKVVAKGDGIEITKKQMERLHNGEVVHLSNGSVLSLVKEGMSDEEIQAIRRYEELSDDDKLKLAKIQTMMDRERSLREDDLNESMIESQFEDLNQVVRNIHHVGEYDSLEEAAAEAMERIGQEFGIAFEFGRDY
jgi:hypothetical protein